MPDMLLRQEVIGSLPTVTAADASQNVPLGEPYLFPHIGAINRGDNAPRLIS
jgi:hypothetical protein